MLWNASSSRRELHHHRYQHSPSFSTLPNCYKELLRSHNFHSPESIKFLRSELLRNHVLTHFKERKLEGSKSNVSNQVPPEASPGEGGAAKRLQELQQRHNMVDGHLLFRAPAWAKAQAPGFPAPLPQSWKPQHGSTQALQTPGSVQPWNPGSTPCSRQQGRFQEKLYLYFPHSSPGLLCLCILFWRTSIFTWAWLSSI